MMSDFRSATVKSTVPALKEDTPDVTVSPSSTPFLITTPVIGEVTRAFCDAAFPEIGMPRSSTIWYRSLAELRLSFAWSSRISEDRRASRPISPLSKRDFWLV